MISSWYDRFGGGEDDDDDDDDDDDNDDENNHNDNGDIVKVTATVRAILRQSFRIIQMLQYER